MSPRCLFSSFAALALVLSGFPSATAGANSTTFTVVTSRDAFVATGSPDNPNLGASGIDHDLTTSNYGDAGTLAIASSGYSYLDSSGARVSKGAFESLIQFDLSGATALFDTTYGAGQWKIQSITLELVSNWGTAGAIPNNPIFNSISGGDFVIEWLANDSWEEGTGYPNDPTTDGVTYSDLPSLLAAGHEALGTYTYVPPGTTTDSDTGLPKDIPLFWQLPLKESLLKDADAGGAVSLLFRAADDHVSYLFNSKKKIDHEPQIHIVAVQSVPEPAAAGLLVAGLAALHFIRSRGRRPIAGRLFAKFSRSRKTRAAFTLVELLVVVAILCVLCTIAYGAATSCIDRARGAACLGNLRQWGAALQGYIADNGGFLPRRGQGVQAVWIVDRPEDWFNALPPYMNLPSYYDLYAAGKAPKPHKQSVFVCPAAVEKKGYRHFICYGMNMYLSRWDQRSPTRVAQIPDPTRLVFLADSPGGYASTIPSASPYSTTARHCGNANIVFIDGHARSFPGEYLGCGKGEKTQPDVHWRTKIGRDSWQPNL